VETPLRVVGESPSSTPNGRQTVIELKK